MTSLLEDDPAASMLDPSIIEEIKDCYREMLLLNPPTPSFFNTRTDPNAERFAGFATKKDVQRFLDVLDKLGLTITKKEADK